MDFFPMHLLGLDGMPRRIATYANETGGEPMNLLSTIGAFLIAVSIIPFIINVVLAFRLPPDQPNDPWEGNTLEWATTSPPPVHNFDSLPPIKSERPLFDARQENKDTETN